MIQHIGILFVLSFTNRGNHPTRDSFNKYYMPLVEIKDFNALINNIPIFVQHVKIKQDEHMKKYMKILLKCQEMIIIQQEVIINSLL